MFPVILFIWIAGIFFSRFLQSVGTIASCVVALLIFSKLSDFKKAIKSPLFIAFACIFLLHLLSVFNSENKIAYLDILKNKIPFLFLPLSLYIVNDVDKKYIIYIQYFFIGCCLLCSAWSYSIYLNDIHTYTHLYTQGQVMPTPVHHVAFSVLISIAILFCIDVIRNAVSNAEKIIGCLLLFWFMYFIHVLSVRTGIVLMYSSLLIMIIYILIKLKKPLFTAALLLLVSLGAYLAFQNIPTLKNKIAYTVYSITQYQNQSDPQNQLSDSRRILSDKIGLELILKHKLSGVGIGDIKDEMHAIYKARYPEFKEEVYARIHNQYLYTTCGTGIPLGLLFLLCISTPLFIFIKQRNLLYGIIYFELLLVMLWEPFLQNQLGTSIFLVMFSLGVISMKKTR